MTNDLTLGVVDVLGGDVPVLGGAVLHSVDVPAGQSVDQGEVPEKKSLKGLVKYFLPSLFSLIVLMSLVPSWLSSALNIVKNNLNDIERAG